MRHFALEQAERGVVVRYAVANGPYRDALEPLLNELGGLEVMKPAERELRADLNPLIVSGALKILPHEGWFTSTDSFTAACAGRPPWRMDSFYRHVRKEHSILMSGEKPQGGKYSFDVQNRRSWKGDPPPPQPPTFMNKRARASPQSVSEKQPGRQYPHMLIRPRIRAQCIELVAATRSDRSGYLKVI